MKSEGFIYFTCRTYKLVPVCHARLWWRHSSWYSAADRGALIQRPHGDFICCILKLHLTTQVLHTYSHHRQVTLYTSVMFTGEVYLKILHLASNIAFDLNTTISRLTHIQKLQMNRNKPPGWDNPLRTGLTNSWTEVNKAVPGSVHWCGCRQLQVNHHWTVELRAEMMYYHWPRHPEHINDITIVNCLCATGWQRKRRICHYAGWC